MAELKPGDRVRVQFEATVESVHWRDVRIIGDNGVKGWISNESCTLIEPEIVLPEEPGTIVQIDPLNKWGQRSTWYFESDRLWGPVGHLGRFRTDDLVINCRAYGYRVIPAATPEEVK